MTSASPPTLTPGVVTGSAYRALIDAAKADGYALAAINVTSSSVINAALAAAARTRTDLVIQLSNGGARFYAGAGLADEARARVLGAVAAARHVHTLARAYGVCVVMHTDHAHRPLVPWVEALVAESEASVRAGGAPLFSSHMLDLSAEPFEDNLRTCAQLLPRLTELGMGLEIELGVTGGEEDGIGHDHDAGADNAHLYTRPEEVAEAFERLRPLGSVSIAASFGNVHGVYRPGNVSLRPAILEASQALVRQRTGVQGNPIDFVFHGGSGSSRAEIAEAISYGVFKMNIDTDTQFAYARGVGDAVRASPRAFEVQLDPDTGAPYKKLYDPRMWLRRGELALEERLIAAFDDLGCRGRSLAAGPYIEPR